MINEIRKAYNLEMFRGEDAKMALVYSANGKKEEAEALIKNYFEYASNDRTVYKHLSLTAYYSYMGQKEKAIENLWLFSEEDNFSYWILLFLELEPLMDNIKDHPEFPGVIEAIETRFWNYHNKIKASLEKEGLV